MCSLRTATAQPWHSHCKGTKALHSRGTATAQQLHEKRNEQATAARLIVKRIFDNLDGSVGPPHIKLLVPTNLLPRLVRYCTAQSLYCTAIVLHSHCTVQPLHSHYPVTVYCCYTV